MNTWTLTFLLLALAGGLMQVSQSSAETTAPHIFGAFLILSAVSGLVSFSRQIIR